MLNPKLGVFFVTLLPQFVHPGQPVLARMIVLGAIFATIGVTWMTGYGLLVTKARDLIDRPRVRAWMERVTGVVLVGFAARLALERA
jgi:threonine/homoserine/homoserine lactone efflux protein